MESLTVGVPYILLQVVSPFAVDSITVLQIERSFGDFVYVAWPTCPFHPNDVARINDGMMHCMITYKGSDNYTQCGYPLFGIQMSFEVFCTSIKQPRSLQHEVEGENVQRLRRSAVRRQTRRIHRGQCDKVPGIPSKVRTREGNHGGPTLPIRPHLLSSGGCFRNLHGSGLQFVRFHQVVCRTM
jgi:hypothetical protein